jgi:malonyl-CoA/methylmalonyl-CoA synthetase
MAGDISDYFLHWAQVRGDKTFLRKENGGCVSYSAALGRSAQYANALNGLGIAKGDRIAVQVTKSPEAVYLYLACLRTGIVFLPLNPAYTAAETRYFRSDAETSLHVCDAERLAEMAALDAPGKAIALLGGASLASLADARAAAFRDAPRDAADLAAILYTSGTTGLPKGVMLTRRNLSSNAQTLAESWHFAGSDVVLHALPIFHTHGLFVAINPVIVAGAGVLFLPGFTPGAVLDALPFATLMMGVPTYFTRLLAEPRLSRAACAHIRVFISGSAPLSAVTHAEWKARTGHAILERYGMTETNMLTSNPYAGERRAGTVGMALPGVAVRVADLTSGTPLPQGEVGVIEVKGPNVFQGYRRMPDKTAADFRADGYFITGDMGRFDADGYLHIVGRAKDMVITGGLNVYPAEVEAELDNLPGVAASAVIGVPHPDFGEAVVAVVTARDGANLASDDLRTALRANLANYKVPKLVLIEVDLPRNALGKIQKNLLRDRHAGLFQGGPDQRPHDQG